MQALNNQTIKNSVSMAAIDLPYYDVAAIFRKIRFNWILFYKYLFVFIAFALVVLSSFYLLSLNLDRNKLINTLTIKFGFYVNNVSFYGNTHFTDEQLIAILGIDNKTFLPSYDATEARNRLLAFPWVKEAAIEKSYPGNLSVHIVERQPYAVVQHDNRLALVDRDGVFVRALLAYPSLHIMPFLIAQDVDNSAMNVVAQITRLSAISSKIKAYKFVANRRWDLLLDNGVLIKLPVDAVIPALKNILHNVHLSSLLNKSGIIIDLRDARFVTVASGPKVQEQVVQHVI